MAGLGKLLKQMQKMKTQMEEIQSSLSNEILEVSSGGGAVNIRISASMEVQSVTIDPEFLKEDKKLIEETLLLAFQEAIQKSKDFSNDKMGQITDGLNLPGMM